MRIRTVRAAALSAAAAVATLVLPALAVADPEPRGYPYDGYGYGHMMWGGGWGGMLFGSGLMVLFVIAVVIILVRALGGSSNGAPSSQAPRNPGLDVLNERYARGEIDTAEYNERKKHLLTGD